MPRTRNPYPTEFRDQIIALAKSGRSIESLAREFEPCVATIHGWVKQAGLDDGDRPNTCCRCSYSRGDQRGLGKEVAADLQNKVNISHQHFDFSIV